MTQAFVSKTTFLTGIVVAILAATIISTVGMMQFVQGPAGINTIENMSGYISRPAYDSGWYDVPDSNDWVNMTFTHGLGTTNIYVDVRRNSSVSGIDSGGMGPWNDLYWFNLTSTTITLRMENGNGTQVRVMLWKIAS